MSEWLIGFTSGVIATVIGFGLTILWDIFKSHRETRYREGRVLAVVREELVGNVRVLNNNLKLISKELQLLPNNKSVVDPLVPLKASFWDLVKINLPKKLMEGDVLLKIRDMVELTEKINEVIQSRENYRIHNRASTNYGVQLQAYDNILVGNIKEFLGLIKGLPSFLYVSANVGNRTE